MSLLQNEEFVLYQLRTAYLSHIKDGVGERLINVNATVLNNPAFRAAGWAPNADIKRTYSPPIPTAITAEYFQAPPRSAGLPGASFGDEEEEGGMVTGGGSNDTVGPALMAKVKRRKEQLEEDDSSDLSDESDEDEAAQRAAQQIKFTKMPLRTRAGSSPVHSSHPLDNPSLLVTSPSRPPESGRFRRGSLGQVEAVKERARRDTTTSSEMSSENEIDPLLFQRKQVNPRRAAKASALLSQRIQEDEQEVEPHVQVVDPGAESDDSSLTSEFEGSADSASFLGEVADASTSPLETRLKGIPPAITPHSVSPKKSKQALSVLQDLPPPRPISVVQPVSALTAALKAKNKKPESPLERFQSLSGKGDPNPLNIKILAPFSNKPTKPYEMLLRRTLNDGLQTTVADAIGLALWRYSEEGLEPPIRGIKMNVNRWTLRMVEDEEVDYDFPALVRTRPIMDFTLNNNRGPRGRSREKPWDEFALVEASDEEFKENEKLTSSYGTSDSASSDVQEEPETEALPPPPQQPQAPTQVPTPTLSTFRNPITGPSFVPTGAPRKDSTALLDAPVLPASHATPRTGAPKTLTIHFTSDDLTTHSLISDVTTDTYLAEVFDNVCARLRLDKALYVLKVSGTNTVAPSDRTVEALGERSDLDLKRRRFIGDGAFGLSGSPGSESPNAPLLITPGTPKKGGRKGIIGVGGGGGPLGGQGSGAGGGGVLHPLAQRTDAFLTASLGGAGYKRYNVTRKQPMSFSSSSARILALDGEYMHIMPAEGPAGGGTKMLFEAPAKTTTVHFSSVVGSKVSRRHPRMFRVVVYKERETKRYDFEAASPAEAQEIVKEIKKGVEKFQLVME